MANKLLTINIRKYLATQPRRKRPKRLSRYVRYKIAQSTNVKSSNVKITKELNSIIMKKTLHSMTPLKISVNVEKEGATAMPFESKPKIEEPAKQASANAGQKKQEQQSKQTEQPKTAEAKEKK